MNLILMGAPGAGKGTQGEIISERFELPEISTGGVLREAIKSGSPLGEQVKSLIAEGKLVPDEIINQVVKDRLSQADCAKGFILDGFPRTLAQAQALDAMGVTIDKVLYINVPDQVILERLGGRRVCEKCGETYHIKHQPSSAGELCEKCGSKLITRSDDKPETIRDRLATYHQSTYPVVEYYRGQGKLLEVDGTGNIEAITERTLRVLEDEE